MRLFSLALGFVVLLSACAGEDSQPAAPPKVVNNISDTDWRLVSLNGESIASTSVIMKFGGGFLSGQAPCNTVNANYLGDLPEFQVELLVSTKTTCPEIALEQDILRGLLESRSAVVANSRLTLSADTGLRMVFEPV